MDAFEKLEVWQRSSRLCVNLYGSLAGSRDRIFRDQILRSALSVPSNTAEGYERDSVREFTRFLNIAKGSCGELCTRHYIGCETGLVERRAGADLIEEAVEIARMLQGLIKRCESERVS